MNSIKDRLTPFSSLNSYISPSALGSPTCVQDITSALKSVTILEHPSRNAIFLDYFAEKNHYVLGKCLFRYDTAQQITVSEFTTANMKGNRCMDKSTFGNGMHILRKPIHGIGMHFFSELISFCKSSGVNCIRLVPDPGTNSMEFYKKINEKFNHLFDKVVGPDPSGAIFFFLK